MSQAAVLDEKMDKLRSRIREILKVRNVSGNAIARKLHLSHSAFHNMMKAGASVPIRNDVLAQIADELDLSVERLTQRDVEETIKELKHLYRTRLNPEKQLRLALDYLDKAVKGTSEEAAALTHIGHAYTNNSDPQEALSFFTQALELLKSIDALENKVSVATLNVCEAWWNLGDYNRLINEAESIQSYLVQRQSIDFYALGKLKHYLALAWHHKGNLEISELFFSDAISFYRIANRNDLVSRTYHDLSNVALLANDIPRAIDLMESSRELLSNEDQLMRAISDKDYAKLLVLDGQLEKAGYIVSNRLQKVKDLGRPVLEAKLLLLAAICTGEDAALEGLFFQENLQDEIKIHVAMLLAKNQIRNYLASKYADILKLATKNLLKLEWF